MKTLIIDAMTGTILDSRDCYIVNTEDLTPLDEQIIEDGGPDWMIGRIGERIGRSVEEILQNAVFGSD